MNKSKRNKLVQERNNVAEVDGEDACKLDDVRDAFRRGDVNTESVIV